MILTCYPPLEDVESLHADIMAWFDRAPERLTNRDAVDAALQRPRNVAHYEHADLATQTALLMASIAAAHACPDGNKRTAVIAGDTFAQNKGYWTACRPLELAWQSLAVVKRELSEEDFAGLIRPPERSLST